MIICDEQKTNNEGEFACVRWNAAGNSMTYVCVCEKRTRSHRFTTRIAYFLTKIERGETEHHKRYPVIYLLLASTERSLLTYVRTGLTVGRSGAHASRNNGHKQRSQARERLLSKVKADQERLKQLDGRTAETANDIETMKRRLADLESDITSDKNGDVAQNKACMTCRY